MGLTPFRRASAQDNPSADFCDQLLRKPIVDGMLVDGSIAFGDVTVTVRHGLGRPYRGAIIVGVSDPIVGVLAPLTPEATSDTTDSSRFVVVLCSPGAATIGTFRLWVF